jgi:hypothetical protein
VASGVVGVENALLGSLIQGDERRAHSLARCVDVAGDYRLVRLLDSGLGRVLDGAITQAALEGLAVGFFRRSSRQMSSFEPDVKLGLIIL